jgi:hypothetical protein
LEVLQSNEGSTFSFILSFSKTTIDVGVKLKWLIGFRIDTIKVLVVEDIPLNY